MIYTDENGQPAFADYVVPSEWGEASIAAEKLGFVLGEDLIPGNEKYIQQVSRQCRHYPRHPWVWHLHELVPIHGYQTKFPWG
jgi:hypothetical protein